jgi:hypothetical protein
MRKIDKRIHRKFRPLFPTNRTVDFVICGTQKGGTSALYAFLREHPEICMANRKEVHFFDNEEHFSNGKPDYSKYYHTWFSPKKFHKFLGEATPIYMYWKDSPRRIWEYNPNMKLIVLLRNPIERAYSNWNMERSRNADNLSFWEAIKNEKVRCREALPQQHRVHSYIDRGYYLEQLRRLWTYFPKDRVLIMKSEDLKQKPDDALNYVCEFLQVSQFKSIEAKNVHSRPYESSMSEKERNNLKSIFEPEIKELETELNWNCSEWLAR